MPSLATNTSEQTAQTLATLGLRADWIEPGELRSRFPQIAVEGLGTVLFEPDAGAIRAKAAVHALVTLAQERPRSSTGRLASSRWMNRALRRTW